MDNELIVRLQEMEERYNRVRKAVDAMYDALEDYMQVQEDIHILDQYDESGQWLKDFEADERGEIPASAPRGILSEDALYNLLTDISALNAKLSPILY
jgi:hypothetical protein